MVWWSFCFYGKMQAADFFQLEQAFHHIRKTVKLEIAGLVAEKIGGGGIQYLCQFVYHSNRHLNFSTFVFLDSTE